MDATNKLKGYLIHFVQTIDNDEVDLYWRCEAENYDHAIEQLKGEVEHCQNEEVLFHELVKTYQ